MAFLQRRDLAADKFRGLLSASASALAICTVNAAYAQDSVDTVPEATANEEQSDKIVVTGSRIRRDEFSSAGPVQVIDPGVEQSLGLIDTASIIQSSSVASGSSQITAAISSNFVTQGGAGASTVSLRGLGANRTLVLLNGRRAGPAGTQGQVNAFDLNVLPTSIIANIEILKDGASSIYGSDAVAGVVNIITKRDTDGLELDGFLSQPLDDGGEEYRATATWGKTFDRGHFLISGDYYKRKELARGQRNYLNCGEERIFDSPGGSRVDLIDPRVGTPICTDLPWGHIWMYDLHYYAYAYGYTANPISNIPPPLDPSTGLPWNPGDRFFRVTQFQYDYPGDNLGSFVPGLDAPRDAFDFTVGDDFYAVGYDPASRAVMNQSHPFVEDVTVIPETTRYTAYLDGAYELTDGVEAYGEFLFNRRETYQNSYRQFWTFGFTNDSFLPDLFGCCGPNPFSPATGPGLESPTAVTDHSDSSQKVDYFRGTGGFRGEFNHTDGFMDGWAWDIYSQYSRSKGLYRNDQIFQDSVDYQYAIGYGYFPTGCEGAVTPISGTNCVTINWWDPDLLAGVVPQAARDHLFGTEEGRTVYTQLYFEGILTGNIVDLPAGPLGAAFGATWRRDEINDLPGDITLAPDPFNPGEFINNAWGSSGAGNTVGSSKTWEIYGEVNIPVLRDRPLVKYFEVLGSFRYTDVSTFGDDYTWKAGVNWAVNDWVRLRGTWGTSFRAPALFELFLADQTSFLSQRNVDPCIQWGANLAQGNISQQLADNCAAQGVPANHSGAGISATIITGGGLGVLDAETSKAKTVGIILEPDFLFPETTRFSVAVDYFDIEVNGEIAQLGAANVVSGCLTSDFFPNDPLCDLFARGQAGNANNISTIRDSFINVNSQKNRGVDLTARLNQDLAEWGDIEFLTQMTWQLKDTIALFEGTTEDLNGEDGEPKWTGDLNIVWTKGPWQAFWGVEAFGRTSDAEDFGNAVANGDVCGVSDVTHVAPYCVDIVAEKKIYNSVSVSRTFKEDQFRLTVGVRNLFDTEPPKVSQTRTNRTVIETVGQVPFQSQYDFVGRRVFVNLNAKF